MLFSNTLQWGFPYRRRMQRDLSSKQVRSIPGMSEIRPMRSTRKARYCGQCRRRCSLSSLARPQIHTEVRQSNACLKRCYFRLLNWRRIDSVLSKHLETANVFKGTSKAIQNELSDTIFDICREFIRKEIKESDFLAIISDNATDVSNYSQNVGVFRYIKNETIVERFWSFCTLSRGGCNHNII